MTYFIFHFSNQCFFLRQSTESCNMIYLDQVK
jgi:hypothetical protein